MGEACSSGILADDDDDDDESSDDEVEGNRIAGGVKALGEIFQASGSSSAARLWWAPKPAFEVGDVLPAGLCGVRPSSRKVIRNRKAAASRAIEAALSSVAGRVDMQFLPDDVRRLLTVAEVEQMALLLAAE